MILKAEILMWALDKGLLKFENRFQQYAKFQEEAGELAKALLTNNREELQDAIGDVLVTLIILANQCDTDVDHCLGLAYHEIKDRKGKTVNGTFIKE